MGEITAIILCLKMNAEKRKYKGSRYSVVLAKSTAEKVESLATEEGRSISQMIAKLVEEALETREDKRND